MAASPRRRQRRRSSRHPLRTWLAAPEGLPTGWLIGTGFLYAAAGVMLAAFPVPYWIWILALAGAIAQALALAGPRALARFGGWHANLLALLAILGAGALVVSLAVALNYYGTDNLDQLAVGDVAAEVVQMSLVALVTAALAAIIKAETGDRLLAVFGRLQTSVILTAVSIAGLGSGALVGVAVVAV